MAVIKSYPFDLEGLGAVGQSILFLVKEKTFNEIFGEPLKPLLGQMTERVEALAGEMSFEATTMEGFVSSLNGLEASLDDYTSLLDLMTTADTDWSDEVLNLSRSAPYARHRELRAAHGDSQSIRKI